MIENSIISKCKKGDQHAYSLMYKACAPYIFSIIKNYFSNDDDRKDALQEVFAQIFLSITHFDDTKGSFKSWASKLTVYQCIAILRKKNKLQINYSLEVVEDVEETALDAIEKLSVHDLELMLKNMPDGYRTIFLLSVIDEYSHKEIGDMLGISAETSRSQLFRGIKWIKNNILNKPNMLQYGLL